MAEINDFVSGMSGIAVGLKQINDQENKKEMDLSALSEKSEPEEF